MTVNMQPKGGVFVHSDRTIFFLIMVAVVWIYTHVIIYRTKNQKKNSILLYNSFFKSRIKNKKQMSSQLAHQHYDDVT